ncbi:MAG: hypothetical protein FJ405_04345, partial [Verrucomicrobia bacterium]|nr:hypothetical protein [Verrucomicrobiota bacterium]
MGVTSTYIGFGSHNATGKPTGFRRATFLACTLLGWQWSSLHTLAAVSPASSQDSSASGWLIGVAGVALIAFLLWLRIRRPQELPNWNPFSVTSKSGHPGPVSSRESEDSMLEASGGGRPQPTDSPGTSLFSSGEGFIYCAAHDLQEPLRKVKSQLSRLETRLQSTGTQEARGEMEAMRRTLNRMQNLLDSL